MSLDRAPLDFLSNKMLAVIHSSEPTDVEFLERAFALDWPLEKVRETLDSLCAKEFVSRGGDELTLSAEGERYCRQHGLDFSHEPDE